MAWKKVKTTDGWLESWLVIAEDDTVVARVVSESIADIVIAGLAGWSPAPPVFAADTLISRDEPDPDEPWYCQNCGVKSTLDDFTPTEGCASRACPRCGSHDNVFPCDRQ